MNYTLKPEKGDYDIDGNKVTIHLNTVARNFSGYKMSKHINLNIITKVTDPSIKSFTNSAQMVIDGNMLHKVSATTGFDKSFLKKGMAYSRDTAPYAEYTILVNQPGADISNGTPVSYTHLDVYKRQMRNPEQMHRRWKHLKPVWKSPG